MEALPAIDGFSLAPDWRSSARCWLAWPGRVETWGAAFEQAGRDFAAVARAVAEYVPVTVLAPPGAAAQAALLLARRAEILGSEVEDAWLADFAPLPLRNDAGEFAGLCCRFNGWGNRVHDYAGDEAFAAWWLQRLGLDSYACPLTLEAGAISGDGQGTLLAARNVLLNANRNPTLDQRQVEDLLALYLGVRKVIWLEGAPLGHAGDGQLLPLARFTAPGHVLCATAATSALPWQTVLEHNKAQLRAATDALGRRLEVVELPLPSVGGDVARAGGLPSYLGYCLVNDNVLVPGFGEGRDGEAAGILSNLFPEREICSIDVGVMAARGGGLPALALMEPVLDEQQRRLP